MIGAVKWYFTVFPDLVRQFENAPYVRWLGHLLTGTSRQDATSPLDSDKVNNGTGCKDVTRRNHLSLRVKHILKAYVSGG